MDNLYSYEYILKQIGIETDSKKFNPYYDFIKRINKSDYNFKVHELIQIVDNIE